MLSALAQEFQELVKRQIIVRVAIDRHWPTSRSIDLMHIEFLIRHPEFGRITRFSYKSPLTRTKLDRHSSYGQIKDDDFRDDNDDAWNRLVDDWTKSLVGWGEPVAFLAVNLIGEEKRAVSPGHPRLLQEFSRIQVLLEQRVRGRRGSQGDYVQAFRQLGHLIETQNRTWSVVYPL